MAIRIRIAARIGVFAIGMLLIHCTQLSAQATIEFRRFVLRWPEVDLHFIARCDGGVVHPTNPSEVHLFDEGVPRTVTAVSNAGDETVATFTGGCPNGGAHRLLIAVTLPCGTTPTESQSYTAPYDPTAFRTLRVGPYGMQLPAGRTTMVPFYLLDPVGGTHQQKYTLNFSIDSSIARPLGVSAPAGTLLEGTEVSYIPWPARTIEFTLPATGRQNDTGVLFYLELAAPARGDSAGTFMNLWGSASDVVNCTNMEYLDAGFLVVPPAPRLECESKTGADTLRWAAGTGAYIPDPYIFKPVLRNTGTDDARTPVFRLQWDPDDLVLHPGYRDTVLGRPTRVAPGQLCDAEWRFDVPEKAARSHTTRVTAVVEYAGGEPVVCSRDIVLLREPFAVLTCAATVPAVTWSDVMNRYVPMPIPLTVDVQNAGDGVSDTVFVEALLPDGLAFSRGESAVKTLTPAVLAAFSGGSAEWMLSHGRTDVEKTYEITVRCWTATTSATECRTQLTIPASPPQPFATTLGASGPLAFCAGDSVVLDGGSAWASWLWPTGDTTRLLRVTTSGSYWCEVRDGNGRAGMSDTLTVTVWPLPPVPGLVRDGDVLRSTGAEGMRHQWYRDGWPLAGETADTLRLLETGAFVLHVYSEEGCEAVSLPYDVSVLSVSDAVVSDSYILYSWPEPMSADAQVMARVPAGESATLLLVDLLGRGELLYEGRPADGRLELRLDLSRRAAGSWLLVLRSGETVRVRRITRM